MTTREDLRAHVARLVADTAEEELPALAAALAQGIGDAEARLKLALARRVENPITDGEQLLTIPEAAKLAAMSPSWVKRMIREGKLPALVMPATSTGTEVRHERQGRARRVRRRDLLLFLAGLEAGGDYREQRAA